MPKFQCAREPSTLVQIIATWVGCGFQGDRKKLHSSDNHKAAAAAMLADNTPRQPQNIVSFHKFAIYSVTLVLEKFSQKKKKKLHKNLLVFNYVAIWIHLSPCLALSVQ